MCSFAKLVNAVAAIECKILIIDCWEPAFFHFLSLTFLKIVNFTESVYMETIDPLSCLVLTIAQSPLGALDK